MAELEQIIHPFKPIYDEESRILILGSLPSVKSREQNFYYGHPRNRFWKVLAAVTNEACPQTIEEKKSFLLKNHIAIWDVIESCKIKGSSDSTITDVKANDISDILKSSRIQAVFCNGKTAEKYYKKYIQPTVLKEAAVLPSTSPANAAWSLEKLVDKWKEELKPYL